MSHADVYGTDIRIMIEAIRWGGDDGKKAARELPLMFGDLRSRVASTEARVAQLEAELAWAMSGREVSS